MYIRHCSAKSRYRRPDLLFYNLPTVPAPESGLSHRLVSLSYLNQPIQISFTPAVTGQAVERKGVVVTAKLFNCPHANH